MSIPITRFPFVQCYLRNNICLPEMKFFWRLHDMVKPGLYAVLDTIILRRQNDIHIVYFLVLVPQLGRIAYSFIIYCFLLLRLVDEINLRLL